MKLSKTELELQLCDIQTFIMYHCDHCEKNKTCKKELCTIKQIREIVGLTYNYTPSIVVHMLDKMKKKGKK